MIGDDKVHSLPAMDPSPTHPDLTNWQIIVLSSHDARSEAVSVPGGLFVEAPVRVDQRLHLNKSPAPFLAHRFGALEKPEHGV